VKGRGKGKLRGSGRGACETPTGRSKVILVGFRTVVLNRGAVR